MSSDARQHVPVETVAQLLLIAPGIPSGPAEQQLIAQHKPIIAAAIGELERALKRLARDLEHAPFAVVFEPVIKHIDKQAVVTAYRKLEHGPSLDAAITAYCTLELAPEDLVNTPVRCYGAIGVYEQRIIDQAVEVNRLKGVLKNAFQPLTNHRITATLRQRGKDIVTKIPAGLYILRQLEKSSLNRLGAYRKLPLIRVDGEYPHPPTPIAIRFTESYSRSVVKRSVARLIQEAKRAHHYDIVNILERSGIPANECLYSPKKPYPRMRANLSFPGTSAADCAAKNYMGELPILFRLDRKLAKPKVTGPKARRADGPRRRRAIPLCDKAVINHPTFYRRLNPADREFAKSS